MFGEPDPLEAFGKALRPHPEVMVWCVLIATQVAIWSYVAEPAYRRAAGYAGSFRGHRRALVIDLVVLVVLTGIFVFAHRNVTAGLNLPVASHDAKVLWLYPIGFATVLPCLMGMRLVAIAARAEAAVGVNTASLERFARLRTDLQWFLGAAAVIVGAATFTNGAFRNALNALNDPDVPPSEVLLYGGFSSGLLALFYLASHEVFSRSGWALIRAAEPVRDDDTPGAWADVQARRQKLADAMGVGTSTLRAFQEGAAILTPLFGSGIGLLLAKT